MSREPWKALHGAWCLHNRFFVQIQRVWGAADRAAQGITEADERAGEEALQNGQWLAGDRLLVVRLAHSHSAVVADRLEMDARPPENLLVVSPDEVNFYGSGTMIATLTARYGGWSGGALPVRGFWGQSPTPNDVVEYLTTAVESPRGEIALPYLP